jgi:hypothetical protein
VDQRKLTPPYVRYLARVIRPFPNWDFFFIKSLRQKAVEALQLKSGSGYSTQVAAPVERFPI